MKKLLLLFVFALLSLAAPLLAEESKAYQKIAITGHTDGSVEVSLVDFEDKEKEAEYLQAIKEEQKRDYADAKEMYKEEKKDKEKKKNAVKPKKPSFKLLPKAYKDADAEKMAKDLEKATAKYTREKGGKKPKK